MLQRAETSTSGAASLGFPSDGIQIALVTNGIHSMQAVSAAMAPREFIYARASDSCSQAFRSAAAGGVPREQPQAAAPLRYARSSRKQNKPVELRALDMTGRQKR